MEFKDGDFVVGVWVVDVPNRHNWMLTLIRRDGQWCGEYRHRYVRDTKIWDSQDRKSFYELEPKPESEHTLEEVVSLGLGWQ